LIRKGQHQVKQETRPPQTDAMSELSQFPLLEAIFGRRSRRFGMGMEIPSGPLAHTSSHEPEPLSELEQSILIAAGTGVSGWNFGVPYGPAQPDEHGQFTVRYTGRTAPTAAGIGTPVLFYSDDTGTYLTNTRDVKPSRIREMNGNEDDVQRILQICRENTTKLSDSRLDLPSKPGHLLDPNFWMANAPGSTMFMPMADASEEFLGILGIFAANGYVIMDAEEKRPAGDVQRFIDSGLLKSDKVFPLQLLQQSAYEATCAELAFISHNIVLTMQAMGLGGLYYNGFNRWSILGAFAKDGIQGLGFRFTTDESWVFPNAVGLDGVYESLSPPYFPDMRAAVEAFAARKFGPGGSYDPASGGGWKDPAAVLSSVTPYSDEVIDYLSEVSQYVYDKHGSFPGTFNTIVFPGLVQAQHIDTEFYDTHYQSGAYLDSHARHFETWHRSS
jgi:hypothetical protein